MRAALLLLLLGCSRPVSVEKWGIEPISLRPAGGSLLHFRYRVVDARKAALLFERKLHPYLIAQGVHLAVLEDAKRLLPVAGTSYDVLFANGRDVVKPGARVTVVLGPCHLDGVGVD